MPNGHSGEAKGHDWYFGLGPYFAISDCPQGSPGVIVTAEFCLHAFANAPFRAWFHLPWSPPPPFLVYIKKKTYRPFKFVEACFMAQNMVHVCNCSFCTWKVYLSSCCWAYVIHVIRSSCFTHGSVCVLMLLSLFIPLSPSPAVSTSPFSSSASPFLPYK